MARREDALGLLVAGAVIVAVLAARFATGTPRAFSFEPGKIRGDPDAEVFIVEFGDFACGACRDLQPALKEIIGRHPRDLKLVYKHFPLNQFPHSFTAAEASECAREQGVFWPYHDLLFEHAAEWPDSKDLYVTLGSYASRLGLDRGKFDECLNSHRTKAVVEQNRDEGLKAGVNSTPACFVNGREGLKSFRADKIEERLEKEWRR